MRIASYYDAKLGCDNCGLADFYVIPRGYEIMPFTNANQSSDGIVELSSLRQGANNEGGVTRPLDCKNCRLPFLGICGWEKHQLPVKQQSPAVPNDPPA